MSAETLTYDQIAQRMNLMAAGEVTSRLEGEIAGLRTPRQTVVPTVVVFFVFRRQFVEGMMMQGLKG